MVSANASSERRSDAMKNTINDAVQVVIFLKISKKSQQLKISAHSHSIVGCTTYLIEKQSEKIFSRSNIPSRLPSKSYRL